ncbi:hypothetical protein [Actinorhabdospora filicis]|uniref:hypothetical protein n=1 Tax=Actinorhabdospora filicis TaxID=1785913 RepID=UPI003D7F4F7A
MVVQQHQPGGPAGHRVHVEQLHDRLPQVGLIGAAHPLVGPQDRPVRRLVAVVGVTGLEGDPGGHVHVGQRLGHAVLRVERTRGRRSGLRGGDQGVHLRLQLGPVRVAHGLEDLQAGDHLVDPPAHGGQLVDGLADLLAQQRGPHDVLVDDPGRAVRAHARAGQVVGRAALQQDLGDRLVGGQDEGRGGARPVDLLAVDGVVLALGRVRVGRLRWDRVALHVGDSAVGHDEAGEPDDVAVDRGDLLEQLLPPSAGLHAGGLLLLLHLREERDDAPVVEGHVLRLLLRHDRGQRRVERDRRGRHVTPGPRDHAGVGGLDGRQVLGDDRRGPVGEVRARRDPGRHVGVGLGGEQRGPLHVPQPEDALLELRRWRRGDRGGEHRVVGGLALALARDGLADLPDVQGRQRHQLAVVHERGDQALQDGHQPSPRRPGQLRRERGAPGARGVEAVAVLGMRARRRPRQLRRAGVPGQRLGRRDQRQDGRAGLGGRLADDGLAQGGDLGDVGGGVVAHRVAVGLGRAADHIERLDLVVRGVEADLRDEPLRQHRARPPSAAHEGRHGGVPGGALEAQEPVRHGDDLGVVARGGLGLVFGSLDVPHALTRVHRGDVSGEASANHPLCTRTRT